MPRLIAGVAPRLTSPDADPNGSYPTTTFVAVTAFGQIGRGFLIGASVVAVAAIVAAVAGANVVVLVTLILLVVFGTLGTVFTVVQLKMFGSTATLRRIEQAGIPAIGVIENVGGTSGRVNANPIMRLTLTIGVGQAVVRTVVPIQHLTRIIVGSKLPVLVDPDDPYHAIVDWPRIDSL